MSANEQAVMAEFAQGLWNNYIRQKIDELFTNNVSFYLASVTANPGNGTLTVQAPLDNARTVSCTNELSSISVGSQVAVLKLGNGNAALNHLAFLSVSNNALINSPISIANGGTGATAAADAISNLGGVPILSDAPDDLDNVATTCITNYAGTASHTPNSAGGSMLTMRFSSTYVHQIATPNSSTGAVAVYARMKYASGWTSWVSLT